MNGDLYLTENNGARALAFGKKGQDVFAEVAVQYGGGSDRVWVAEAVNRIVTEGRLVPWDNKTGVNAAIAVSFDATNPRRNVFWSGENADEVVQAETLLTYWGQDDWQVHHAFGAPWQDCQHVAVAAAHTPTNRVYACYFQDPAGEVPGGVFTRSSADDGWTWSDTVRVVSDDYSDNFSLAANDEDEYVYVAVHIVDVNLVDSVLLYRSTDYGASWTRNAQWGYAIEPCVTSSYEGAAVAWVSTAGDHADHVYCAWTVNRGGSWTSGEVVGGYNTTWPGFEYAAPSVHMLHYGSGLYHVIFASELTVLNESYVSSTWGELDVARGMSWNPWGEHYLNPACEWPGVDDFANPCVGIRGASPDAAMCVWVDDGTTGNYNALWGRDAEWKLRYYARIPTYHAVGPGRLIRAALDGTPYYVARAGANLRCGRAHENGYLEPGLLGSGTLSALALDADNGKWICFLCDDTVWCRTGTGRYKLVFAGSSSAVPGQPSIVCYPNQANGTYVSAVVFAVYDTGGGTSRIMFGRVCTSGVVLDTIESVQDLGDSLPCISTYKNDSLICTWQHSGAVYSALLPDYGPGTSSRPGAWSSPSLVTADGYHPMSVMENNGSVINCVWVAKDTLDNYSICRATKDLSSSMFSGWTSQTDPSDDAAVEKSGPVYAGVGVTAWAQMVSGKWVIKGKVRGEETTFVSDSVGAYHPHAVAESIAINPSTDRLRVYLLYTAGVTFEVDSGVTDTGETRFAQFEYDVSHAGSNATSSNSGTKLLRKAGGDSLFCLYADDQDAVWYAWSAAGDSWRRDQLTADRDWPAIAEDSSGRRWAVLHGVDGGTSAGLIEAYHRDSSSWSEPQTVFTADAGKAVGPAALAGASSTTQSQAYAAFKVEGDEESYIKVAKFDGSDLDTCTIASGASLGDPSITVEPVSQDSDRIHVTWSDNGEVKYRMNTDGRGLSIANNWTSTINLSNTQNPSVHPFIAANREQVVVAWAEGDTADIYCRKHSTDSAYNNWQSSANLSNTNKASDYPTIAMGDTVIVAWEEHRSTSDFDIIACIDFDDTLNVADNATVSSYPHVLFQNKTSGDTAIPYLHTVWSEAPEANVYEVGYNKLNLKQAFGGGQQSAGPAPLPGKPSLAACRPNPFRDRTQIAYSLPSAGNVSLRVYDVTGRTVRTLQNGFQKPGAYSVNWDSRDSRGRQVPHGVYFYRLDTPGFRAVRKAVVAR
jgi:hypothetical protein